jgi:hypothetical protein
MYQNSSAIPPENWQLSLIPLRAINPPLLESLLFSSIA